MGMQWEGIGMRGGIGMWRGNWVDKLACGGSWELH